MRESLLHFWVLLTRRKSQEFVLKDTDHGCTFTKHKRLKWKKKKGKILYKCLREGGLRNNGKRGERGEREWERGGWRRERGGRERR